jgi:UDP-N-acetylglucosamine/UDP-N-acetylgalactosamine diphosphorylase
VFEECEHFGLFETLREDEFAPIKNATGEDSPESAIKMVRDLHRRWLEKAKIKIEGKDHFEIDPRLCYDGEDLSEISKNIKNLKVQPNI